MAAHFVLLPRALETITVDGHKHAFAAPTLTTAKLSFILATILVVENATAVYLAIAKLTNKAIAYPPKANTKKKPMLLLRSKDTDSLTHFSTNTPLGHVSCR